MKGKSMARPLAAFLLALMIFAGWAEAPAYAAMKGKTGIGMAEWAFRAYNEGWTYSYGGSSAGKVDCSGLIRSYCNGQGGGAKALLNASSVNGSTGDMPRIHGLGLWCEGHAGVYVGKNKDGVDMAIDMRNSKVNVVYAAMNSRYYSPWKKWFKISYLSYPTTGWYEFRGSKYYYKNGEFVVGAVKIDGKTYDFGKSGALQGEIDSSKLTTTTKKTTTTTTTTTKTTTTTTTATTTEKTTVTTEAEVTSRTTEATTTTAATEQTTTTEKIKSTTQTEKPTTTKKSTTKKTTTEKKAKTTTTKKTTQKTTTTKQKGKTTTTKKTTTKKTTTSKGAASTTQKRSTTKKLTTTTTTGYKSYEGGMSGEVVTQMQERLTALGYYDQDITGYYGPFTRDAIKAFQKALGVLPTGIADEATQKALFAADAPAYSENNSLMKDDDYQDAEEQEEEEQTQEEEKKEEVTVIAASEGIGALSMSGNPYQFTQNYGESGPLQTMGVFSYQSPSVVFYRNGESYEVTEEMMESLENCVFM